MSGIKTSFILTGSELLLLIERFDTGAGTSAAQYVKDVLIKETGDNEKAEEGLIEKKLIRKASGMLFVEPVIELIVKEMITAGQIAMVKPIGGASPFYILYCTRMLLMLASYELKEGSFRITPFPDMDALKAEVGENGIDIDETEVIWAAAEDELTCIDDKL